VLAAPWHIGAEGGLEEEIKKIMYGTYTSARLMERDVAKGILDN
jgi:hypothetical protein